MIDNRAVERSVPVKVMFKASSGLEKFNQAQSSRKSQTEILQALKDYEEILKQYEVEYTQQSDSMILQDGGWSLDEQVLMDLVDNHVAKEYLAQFDGR